MPPMTATTPPRISLCRINKTIGQHRILRDVSLDVHSGEIHVLVGANGAGKSTLIRILSGADGEFEGEILRDGQRLTLRGPRAGRRAGIHVIYQELSLVNCLSAVDNWVLAEERGAFSWLSRDQARNRVREHCQRFGLKLDLEIPVERLTLSERQLLEIARALSEQAQVLVLDEPTSALSETEATRLLTQLERLRQTGAAILYVSHRMEEIYQIADRITVLRDGVRVVTSQARELPRTELVAAMVGETAAHPDGATHREDAPSTPTRAAHLRVQGLCAPGRPALRGIDFEAHPGEIFGVCGLRGSGAGELLEVLGGARRRSSGTVEYDNMKLAFETSRAAFSSGVALLPPDRKQSVFPALNLLWNASLSALERYSVLGVLARRRCRQDVSRLAETMALGQYSLDAEAGSLSGGNQQKLALLRCLLVKPKVLLLSEPTRGVDIAAKEMLHEWMKKIAGQGLTVIVQSSELDELVALCEQVLVLGQGRRVATLRRAELSRQSLLAAMMGSAA
jgi:ribose transport system ATP-binding protein